MVNHAVEHMQHLLDPLIGTLQTLYDKFQNIANSDAFKALQFITGSGAPGQIAGKVGNVIFGSGDAPVGPSPQTLKDIAGGGQPT